MKVSYENPTEIVFNEEMASVILGFPAESISMQNTSNPLFIQPLVENLSGDVIVVMKDGKSKTITLISTLPELRDRSVRIVDQSQTVSDRVKEIDRAGITPGGLIKAMILGEDLDGVSISKTNQIIIRTPLQLVANTVYDAVFLKGYIVDITDHPNLDIKPISMRSLLAGTVYKGKAYFVFEGAD